MKISITLGGTFLVDDQTNQYLKPTVEIGDIDPEKDLDEQLEQAKVTVEKSWSKLVQMLVDQMKKTINEKVL